MPSREELLNSMSTDTIFDESFFQKIYGYSITDSNFLVEVVHKLFEIDRTEVAKDYNIWLTDWKAKDDIMRKEVSKWYHKELECRYENWKKKTDEIHRKEDKKAWQMKRQQKWEQICNLLDYQ